MVESCQKTCNLTVKYLCSYGGKILPRYPDRKLHYHGGQTRLLTCNHSTSFSELMGKLGEFCGRPVSLRCQLPTEDLDVLVSITSDKDLANLLEEYDRASSTSLPIKIKAFLSPRKTIVANRVSPRLSHSSPRYSSKFLISATSHGRQCVNRMPNTKLAVYPFSYGKSITALNAPRCASYGYISRVYLVHN